MANLSQITVMESESVPARMMREAKEKTLIFLASARAAQRPIEYPRIEALPPTPNPYVETAEGRMGLRVCLPAPKAVHAPLHRVTECWRHKRPLVPSAFGKNFCPTREANGKWCWAWRKPAPRNKVRTGENNLFSEKETA